MPTLMELEVAELSPAQRKHYELCLSNGSTPKMALMLATRHGPEMKGSDRAFGEGQRRKMSRIPAVNQKMLDIAAKAGISTSGKFHVSALGRYDNPLAWCSTIEDARKSAQLQNLNTTGLITNRAVELPPPPPVALAADLIDDEVSKRLSTGELAARLPRSPERRAKKLLELREQIVSERGRPQRKSGRGGSLGQKALAALAGSRSPQ